MLKLVKQLSEVSLQFYINAGLNKKIVIMKTTKTKKIPKNKNKKNNETTKTSKQKKTKKPHMTPNQ